MFYCVSRNDSYADESSWELIETEAELKTVEAFLEATNGGHVMVSAKALEFSRIEPKKVEKEEIERIAALQEEWVVEKRTLAEHNWKYKSQLDLLRAQAEAYRPISGDAPEWKLDMFKKFSGELNEEAGNLKKSPEKFRELFGYQEIVF